MPKAICKDCGSLVEAELTHNGVCEVGHYVHCGWGHDLSADELISDYAAYHIEELKGKLAKAMEHVADYSNDPHLVEWANATIAELKGETK